MLLNAKHESINDIIYAAMSSNSFIIIKPLLFTSHLLNSFVPVPTCRIYMIFPKINGKVWFSVGNAYFTHKKHALPIEYHTFLCAKHVLPMEKQTPMKKYGFPKKNHDFP